MKTFKNQLLLVCVLFFSAFAFAQAPQSVTSQAVLRTASGELVANRTVSVKITIRQGSATGAVVYSETHSVATNANGLYTVFMGQGTVLSGSFSSINWGNGPYFVVSEADPNGGSNYSLVTTQQLQSVPYALYADTAANYVERQVLSMGHDTIYLTGGSFVVLSSAINTSYVDSVVRAELGVNCYASCASLDSLRRHVDSAFRRIDSILNGGATPTPPEPEHCSMSVQSANVTACDSYTWHGHTVTSTGWCYDTVWGTGDVCDTFFRKHITINHATYYTDVQTATGSYTWIDGNTYTESNTTATYTLTNVAGCDSIVTLNLTITATPPACETTYAIDVQTATGSYTWIDGNTYTSSNNTATYTIRKSDGCDSIVTLNLTITESPVSGGGLLDGEFSVSATQKVRFSQGNLQYMARGVDGYSDGTWRFAMRQYDFVGGFSYDGNAYGEFGNVYANGRKCSNDNVSSSYAGWIDLFGWGTSGWNSGANAYQPYSTSTSTSDYYVGGAQSNDLTGEYANADWGRYNTIVNGSSTNQWRTLTAGEWDFLLFQRTNASNLRTLAVVQMDSAGSTMNVMGMVLLPDDWVAPSDVTIRFTYTMAGSFPYGYSTNIWWVTDWEKLERNGAVFLPFNGKRSGSGSGSFYTEGAAFTASYWSASANNTNATYISFGGMTSSYKGHITSNGRNRSTACSVRLVYDVQ